MEKTQTMNPKKIHIGETYMINYIGWKKIKVININGKDITVQEHEANGDPFKVDIKRIKINLL